MPKKFTDEYLATLPEGRRKSVLLERSRRWRPEIREQARLRAATPENRAKQSLYKKRPEVRARLNERYATDEEHREKARWRTIKSRFGITKEQWLDLFERQGRRCACCPSTDPGHRFGWAIDHDKLTGRIRGIVCQPCNRILGMLGDNLETAQERARMYLSYLGREEIVIEQTHPTKPRRMYTWVRKPGLVRRVPEL